MLTIVKIGGHIIDSQDLLDGFLKDFSSLQGPKILVHGGGKRATKMAEKMGVQNRMIEGRRITDTPMLDIVIQSFTSVNKMVVAKLQRYGIQSVGLTGADLDSIRAKKRVHPDIDYGWVGDIEKINFSGIRDLLRSGITPVFCALTHDGKGQLLNTNADTIASSLAQSSTLATELIYCFEKAGVLTNEDDDGSIIKEIDLKLYKNLLASGVIHSGMKPKIDNALDALRGGVQQVRITHFKKMDGGTRIRL